jgi:hypothetical protein
MNFDIRLPIGLMFSILGALLLGYGVLSEKDIYRHSLGININLIWGVVMLVFGLIMLWLGRSATRSRPPR